MTTPIPRGRTALRLQWQFLPPHLRAEIEGHCGSRVVDAESRDSGFTPGFASVLTCADGTRHFVKAASAKAQRLFADSYREEARKLSALPAEVAAPRLLWWLDDDWVVLGIEYTEGRQPHRPWRRDELDACLDALEVLADQLTPAPMPLDRLVDDYAAWPSYWDSVRADPPDLPGLAAHLEEAALLAAGFAEAMDGTTLVHTDIRDDNVILGPDGRVRFCDWNWPVTGADWVDSLFLLVGPRADGLDVESVIAERRLLRDVPAEHLDRVIALLTGYFLHFGAQPVPPASPYLRAAQWHQGEVCWAWLAQRRGWR